MNTANNSSQLVNSSFKKILDEHNCYPLKECWGILKTSKFANIKPYLCDCGMEMCIYCFIKCHKQCKTYVKKFKSLNLGEDKEAYDLNKMREFIYLDALSRIDSSEAYLFDCPCNERGHNLQKMTGDRSCKLYSVETFGGERSYSCSQCKIMICTFCLKYCHQHSEESDNNLGKGEIGCSCKLENHLNPKKWVEELKDKPNVTKLRFVKNSINDFLKEENDDKVLYKFLVYLSQDKRINDIDFFEDIIQKFYDLKDLSLEHFNDFIKIYCRIFDHYTSKLNLITRFHFSNTSIEYRLEAKQLNQMLYKKNKGKFFYEKLDIVIGEILDKFMKQKKEEKISHCYFLFKLIFYLILDDDTITKILNAVKSWKFTYKKNKWGDAPNEIDKETCRFLNTSVDKMFYCIQVIYRDKYLFTEGSAEPPNNIFKIIDYMNLMYFNYPLPKYRFMTTIINFDSYYNQLKLYSPGNVKEIKPIECYWLQNEFENLYLQMKSLGKENDDEMNQLKNYKQEEVIKNPIKPELEEAFTDLFIKIFQENKIDLNEIRIQMYRNEEKRSEKYNKYLNNRLEEALCESSNTYWIKQMLFKIRLHEVIFEEYLITFLSLYLLNYRTMMHLIYTLEIHKPIKAMLTTSLISLKFVYFLLKKTKATHLEFLNKAVFINVSFILKESTFDGNSENKERATYILKTLCILNKHTKYSIANIGREIIKKMSVFKEFSPKIKFENVEKEEKKTSLPLKDEEEEKSNYASSRGNENEESIELINIKKKTIINVDYDDHSESDISGDSIFLCYLEYLSDFVYYHDEIKEHIYNFIENYINLIYQIRHHKNLYIKYRLIILRFLTNFFVADFINHIDYVAEEKFLQDYDFEGCIKNMENGVQDNSDVNKLSRYQNLYETVLKILIEEVTYINQSPYYKKNDCAIIKSLAISVRKITDMFLIKSDEWINGSYYYMHRLALVFLKETKGIYKMLNISFEDKKDIIEQKLEEIRSRTFEWENPVRISQILSDVFIDINKKGEFITKKYSIISYVKLLVELNSPINKSFYVETIEKLFLKNEKKENKVINDKFSDYFTHDYSVKKWDNFVDSLKFDDTKMIFSFFEHFADNFFFEDVTHFEKYNLFIKVTHPQICKEMIVSKKKKRTFICFEIMNTLFLCNTPKIQILLFDFFKKNKLLFNRFIKNLAIFLKENLFLYIESSFSESSERLAYNFQLLFDILDFLLRLKEEFCMDFVEPILLDVLKDSFSEKNEQINLIEKKVTQDFNSKKPIDRKYLEKKPFYSIYGIVGNSFKTICDLLEKTTSQPNGFPCERILILFYTLSKFLKEYLEGSRKREKEKFYDMIKYCLISNLNFGLLFINNPHKQKELKLIKSQLLTLMTSIVFEFSVEFGQEMYLFLSENITPLKIWEQVIENMEQILHKLNISVPSKEIYINNHEFSSSPELELSVKFYIFLYYWKGKDYVDQIECSFELSEKENSILRFLRKIVPSVECTYGEEKEKKFLTFMKPPESFNLSKETKKDFHNNANRLSRDTKVETLMNNIDLFLFEIYTYDKKIQKIARLYNRFLMEMLNYIFVLIIQLLLLIGFYASKTYDNKSDISQPLFSSEQKYSTVTDVETLTIIQLVFCLFTFIMWVLVKFKLEFRRNYFSFQEERIMLLKDPLDDALDIYNAILKNKETLKKKIELNLASLRVFLIDTLLFNSQINVIFYSIILDIIYLSTGYAPCLVIQVFYICNLSQFLYFIILAAKKKIMDLISVLIFDYMAIYLFSWFAFYHLSEMMTFYDSMDDTYSPIKDNFCTSAIECYLNQIDFGTRSGGGIADIWSKVSFKMNNSMFFKKFFYSIIFYIVIVLILGNIFLGIIVDAFADLRDEASIKENDIKNLCFICDISKGECSSCGIDFEKHRKKEHNIYNYVYFINFLLTKSPDEYNEYESYAIRSIIKGKTQWLPEKQIQNGK